MRETLILVFLKSQVVGGSPAELELVFLLQDLCTALPLLEPLLVPGLQAEDLVGVTCDPPTHP